MPISDYLPDVTELGRFMKTRTRTRFGQVIGTFDENTAVTEVEAQGLIAEAAGEVAIAVGPSVPDGPDDDPDMYRNGAKQLVLILAAMNVEMTLAPETTDDVRSAYAALERRFKSLKDTLVEAITEANGGTEGGEAAGTGGSMVAWWSGPPPMTKMTDEY